MNTMNATNTMNAPSGIFMMGNQRKACHHHASATRAATTAKPWSTFDSKNMMFEGAASSLPTVDVVCSSASDTLDGQRPHKKLRASHTAALASSMCMSTEDCRNGSSSYHLTNVGIANYELGKYKKAEKCFREALWSLDYEFRRTAGVSSPTSSSEDRNHCYHLPTTAATRKMMMDMPLDTTRINSYCSDNDNEDLELLMPSSAIEYTNSTSNNSTANKAPQEEYDEGMRVFKDTLPIEKYMRQEYKSCALLYNIAQTYVNRNQYEGAIKYFELSLSRSNTNTTLQSVSGCVIIRVLHNLGYCNYRLGRNGDAMKYYQHSLSLSLQQKQRSQTRDANDCVWKTTNESDLAASLNAVGVLLFHSSCSSSTAGSSQHVANGKNDSSKNNCAKALSMFQTSLSIYRSLQFEANDTITATLATVLNNIGRVHYICEEYKQALVVYDEALRLRRLALGDNSVDSGATIYNKAQTLFQLGQSQESMKHYTQFLRIAQQRQQLKNMNNGGTPVKETRDVAIVYKCMAEIHHQNSENKLAMALYKKALHAMRSSMGDLHPEVASTLNKLGNLSYEMEDYGAAMTYYEQGLAIERVALPQNHPHIVITLTNIAHIHKQLNNFSGALEMYRQVYELQRQELGPQSIEAAGALSSIGLMQYHMKEYDSAFESYQEALRVRREHYGNDEHPDVASTLNSVGLVLFKQEIFDLAKGCFMESLRIRQKVLGPSHRDVAVLWYNIATICFETGEDDLAIEYYKETLRVERESLGPDHPDTVLTLQHIGNVFHNHGDLESALPFFEEALEIERRRPVVSTNAIGKILNMIGNIRLQEGNIKEMMECYIEASRLYDSNPDQADTLVIAGYNFYGLSKISPPAAPVA